MQLSFPSAPPETAPSSAGLADPAAGKPPGDDQEASFGDVLADLADSHSDSPLDDTALKGSATDDAAAIAAADLLALLARPTPVTTPAMALAATGDGLTVERSPDGVTDAGTAGEGDAVNGATSWQRLQVAGPATPSAEPASDPAAVRAALRFGDQDEIPAPDASVAEPTGSQPEVMVTDEPVPESTPLSVPLATVQTGLAETANPLMSGAPQTALANPLRRVDLRAEKIAAVAPAPLRPASVENGSQEKQILNVDSEEDAESTDAFGIGSAKSDDIMSFSSSHPTSATAAFRAETATAVTGVSDKAGAGAELPPEAAATPAPEIAHKAVAAVTKAIERADAAPKTAVNLQFTVGDSDLVVRIEHRADEVRATFRTDSAELRSALAQEWSAVTGSSSDHALRKVEPVFTASSSGDTFGRSAADGGSSQSQQGASRDPGEAAAAGFAGMFRRATAASAPAPSAIETERTAASLATSLHLQTFA